MNDTVKTVSRVIWGVIIALFFIGMTAFFLLSTIAIPTGEYKKHDAHIVSMGLGTDINGNFYLGSGTINNEPAYVFVIEKSGDNGEKQYVTRQVPASRTTIVEDADANNARIIQANGIRKNALGREVQSGEPYYQIHIPQGSVKHNISLDASASQGIE